jgi:hypothetical protein
VEIVYVVEGLLNPLLSQVMMKELSLLHPNFSFFYRYSRNTSSLESFIYILAVKEVPLKP